MLVFHSARQKRSASNGVNRFRIQAILVLVAVLSSGCGADELQQAAKEP
jgi:hypothetical protein